MIYAVTAFVTIVMFLIWHLYQRSDAYAATCAECDAGKAFLEWRERNQGVYIGLSEEGRLLLGRWLEAYDWFLRTHTFIDGREKREWLVEMFYDSPPKSPANLPATDKGVQTDALSLFQSKRKPNFDTTLFLFIQRLEHALPNGAKT